MLCNQCGKNNPFGVSECTYCGASMPARSACGGFADILTYQPPNNQQPTQNSLASQSTPMGQNMAPFGDGKSDSSRVISLKKQLRQQKRITGMGFLILIVLVIVLLFWIGKLSSKPKTSEPPAPPAMGQSFMNAKEKACKDLKTVLEKGIGMISDNSDITAASPDVATAENETVPTSVPTAIPTQNPKPEVSNAPGGPAGAEPQQHETETGSAPARPVQP